MLPRTSNMNNRPPLVRILGSSEDREDEDNGVHEQRKAVKPSSTFSGCNGGTNGYDKYRVSLLKHLCGAEYADTSSDDLSSDWDEREDGDEEEEKRKKKPSAWRKLRNVVHWSPFVQTYRKQKYPWIQLAGHQGNFRSGTHGTVLKKLSGREETCLKHLMKDDHLREYVPAFKGSVEMEDGAVYLELEDLLAGFQGPCVMDVKVGLRTYLEEELAKAREKPKLRKDMYEKMVAVDPEEPTLEERDLKAVTKPRYMIWRETISSTASLGFRIEGMKNPDGTSTKDFKTTKTREQVKKAFAVFTEGFHEAIGKYLQRLRLLQDALTRSEFFCTHEFIGSSLLFVHDHNSASVWLIDFAKTVPVPAGITITHRDPWEVGNHEDGYLIGITNLISIFEDLWNARSGLAEETCVEIVEP
ncbi:inositol-trisphosphate 3-kinase A-like isoform X2 [Ornithodoros turicata]